jgi:hypothetical protein
VGYSGGVDHVSGSVITVVVFLELGLVGLWFAVGSAGQRRSHFWVRVSLASLGLPALMAALVGIARLNVLPDGAAQAFSPLLFFLGVIALMLVPGLLYRSSGSSPGSSESGGGGGPGPGPPRPPPDVPGGGVPLPDADQASVRLREHGTRNFGALKRRRPAHEPGRTPTRTSG